MMDMTPMSLSFATYYIQPTERPQGRKGEEGASQWKSPKKETEGFGKIFQEECTSLQDNEQRK
ncbi:hypothetical protein [Eubacterium oxidoreducens]|uniref:Uncharacterized protein n=1 Tax=Eubacterium oxidoreducens TaxID=1732 RepID=A0A1G6A6F7_EUBOX|nr:hypothetical protein [Eubacterium oxidoreducens]SDB03876.1 hypothetical protein SAMN02910417_00305 [Eubacterium oxidoreducens]